jgi:hypothetical protein
VLLKSGRMHIVFKHGKQAGTESATGSIFITYAKDNLLQEPDLKWLLRFGGLFGIHFLPSPQIPQHMRGRTLDICGTMRNAKRAPPCRQHPWTRRGNTTLFGRCRSALRPKRRDSGS